MPGSEKSCNGLMPDSDIHIARLEAKLEKLKQNDKKKVSGKEIISSMNEFRDIYMRNYFKNNNKTAHTELSVESEFSSNDFIDKTYLERKLLPEQPISREEVQTLVENDWLVKSNKSNQDEEIEKTSK